MGSTGSPTAGDAADRRPNSTAPRRAIWPTSCGSQPSGVGRRHQRHDAQRTEYLVEYACRRPVPLEPELRRSGSDLEYVGGSSASHKPPSIVAVRHTRRYFTVGVCPARAVGQSVGDDCQQIGGHRRDNERHTKPRDRVTERRRSRHARASASRSPRSTRFGKSRTRSGSWSSTLGGRVDCTPRRPGPGPATKLSLGDSSTSCRRSPGRIPVRLIGYGTRPGRYQPAKRLAVSTIGTGSPQAGIATSADATQRAVSTIDQIASSMLIQ